MTAAQISGPPQSTADERRWESIHVSGTNVRAYFGDNYANNADLFESGTSAQRRTMLLNLLYYEGLGMKRDQLALINATVDSFAWIEQTSFPSWLCDPCAKAFWILGKPGSGKSTLMKYLADSRSTQTRLRTSIPNSSWSILHFFFDYRAARTIANDVLGMLRLFLRQLIVEVPAVEEYARKRKSDFDGGGLDLYTEILAKVIIGADINVCAFIDGLDEYEGNLSDLFCTLENLQSRTGIKMCLASRPEKAFEDALERFDCTVVFVQDHNQEAIAASIRHKIERFLSTSVSVLDWFTPALQERIVERAQGVILWACLVVDEMITCCDDTTSPTAQDSERLIDCLPSGLASLYDRMLNKTQPKHRAEVALILELITAHEYNIEGILDMITFSEAIDYTKRHFMSAPNSKFSSSRLRALLGSMVEIVHTSVDTAYVRTLHKSFSTYLIREQWTRRHLSESLLYKFPDNIWIRLSVDVIQRAEQEEAIDVARLTTTLEDSLNMVVSQRDSAIERLGSILGYRLPTELILHPGVTVKPNWLPWGTLLVFCLGDFFKINLDHPGDDRTDLGFPFANSMALAFVIITRRQSGTYQEITWLHWWKILRLYHSGVLELLPPMLGPVNHWHPQLDSLQRIAEMSPNTRDDLLDSYLFCRNLPIVEISPISDLFKHGRRNRYLCQLFVLGSINSRTSDRIREVVSAYEFEMWSNDHDVDCPFWGAETPVTMHWVIDMLSLKQSIIAPHVDLKGGNVNILQAPDESSQDIYSLIVQALYDGAITPSRALLKYRDARYYGVHPTAIDVTLSCAEKGLQAWLRAMTPASKRPWYKLKRNRSGERRPDEVITNDGGHVEAYRIIVNAFIFYRDNRYWDAS